MVPYSLAIAIGALAGILIASVLFAIWRLVYTRRIRKDAVQRSLAVVSGKVHEQISPYLPGFDYDPRDARFLGSPVDLVVFDGLSRGAVERVIFVEVKTGTAALSPREKLIRDAIRLRRVEWREWRPDSNGS